MRRFQFEADIYETLNCVPMAVRRKLDRIGLKVGLDQWQALSRAERLAVCYLPAESQDESNVLREVLIEATKARFGSMPKDVSEEARREASPPPLAPPLLVLRSQELGYDLSEDIWQNLDDDERYALTKLGNGKTPSHNLQMALAEFVRRVFGERCEILDFPRTRSADV
jgi:hypothetical protein